MGEAEGHGDRAERFANVLHGRRQVEVVASVQSEAKQILQPTSKGDFRKLVERQWRRREKRELLAKAVFDSDSDAWEEATIKIAKSLIMDRKRKQAKVWLYKGQLEAKLGKNAGAGIHPAEKYEERKDGQGDTQYRFVKESDELEGLMRQEMTLSQKGTRIGSELNQLASGFEASLLKNLFCAAPTRVNALPSSLFRRSGSR